MSDVAPPIGEALSHCQTVERTRWPWSVMRIPDLPASKEKFLWPKVTIVTPSFNQGQYIEETIRSVLLQGYPNLEYVIIDGGSTDNTIEIIQKYEPWLTFWVSEPDDGQADAINKGFRRASGDFLGWLNSDDILYPSAIHRVVAAFRSNPDVELIYGDIEQGLSIERGVSQLQGEEIDFSVMLRTLRVPFPQQGSLWKRSVIERIGDLDPRWQVVLDREFYIRVAEKCRVRYLPGTLGFFRNHEKSKSILQGRRWLTELPQMYREFFERSDLPDDLRRLEGETMGAMFLVCASIAHQCGETRRAAGYFGNALKADPLSLFRRHARSKAAGFLRSIIPVRTG